MSRRRRFVAGGFAAAALVIATVGEGAVEARSSAKPLLTEFEGEPLSSPKGIDIAPDGAIIIAQGAFGPPGPVLRYDRRIPNRRGVTAVTDPFNITDVAINPSDGTGWAIAPGSVEDTVSLYHQLADGTIVEVLDITGYQVTDPDPYDQDELPRRVQSVRADGHAATATRSSPTRRTTTSSG